VVRPNVGPSGPSKDCANLDEMPTSYLHVTDVDGVSRVLELPGRAMIERMLGWRKLGEEVQTKESSICAAALAPFKVERWNHDVAILGAPFLRHFYTIFDFGNRRMGFVRAKHGVSALRGVKNH